MTRLTFTNIERGRGGEYRANIVLDGVMVGRVERGWSMGGARASEYRATIGGHLVASGPTLRDLREELREHFAAEYPDARESW